MKKIIACAITVLMLAALFAGCSNAGSGGQTTEPNGTQGTTEGNSSGATASGSDGKTARDTITLLAQSEPATLDSAYANNDNITIVLQFIHEALFTLGADGSIQSELAESVEIIDDITIGFKLLEGVLFSDGAPLTAEDVFFSIDRCQKSPVSQSLFSFVDLENSEIADDHHFTLKFHQAWAPYSNTMGTGRGSIYSKAAFEAAGEENFARSPVGCGPYKLVEWTSGTQIKLTRNDNYHGEPAKTENIVIKFIAEPTARVIELETGAADIAYYIEGTDINRVNGIDGYHVEQGESFRYFTIVLSMQEPLFQDQRVRDAMGLAINKAALTDTASNGVGTPIYGYCPPAMNGYMEMEEIPYDPEQARQLLADAGYADGFEIDLHVDPVSIFEKSAEAVQAMWDEIGIKANIVSMALATYDAQNNGKFQASIRDGTATEISNVLIIYESSFGSRMNGNDDWLDAKLLELRTYYYGDPQRDACLREIMDYIHSVRFTYPYMVMPTVYAVSDALEGFVFHPAEDHIDPKNWVIYE